MAQVEEKLKDAHGQKSDGSHQEFTNKDVDEKTYFTTIEINKDAAHSESPYTTHVYTPSPLKQQQSNTETWERPSPASAAMNTPNSETTIQNHTASPNEKESLEDDSSEGDIDDDKDHSFDWDDDDDDKRKKVTPSIERHHTVKRIRGMYRRYCCWHYLSQFMKRVVIAVIGSSIFITVGVCVYIYVPHPTEQELADPNFTNIRANIQVWMFWAAFMWHIAWVVTFLIEAVPIVVYKWVKFFRGRRSEKVKTYMEYYMSLKLYIGLAIITAFNWGTWAFLIDIPYSSVLRQPYTTILWRVFACLFVASIFLLLQKTIVQAIASRFHRFAFKDRIMENRKAIKILDALGKSEYKGLLSGAAAGLRMRHRKERPEYNTPSPSQADIGTSSSVRTPPAASTHYASTTSDTTINPLSYSRHTSSADLLYSFKKNLRKAVINDQPHLSKNLFKEELDINSDEYARKNAKKLYLSLAYPHGIVSTGEKTRRLLLSDFEPYFKSAEDAKKAFEIFDRDGNGDITRREFRDTVLHVYRERKDISISMRDTSQALGKIDYMLLGVTLVALVFTAFAIFKVEVWHSLVPLGSILLALTFVFGNTAKNTFESVLFLFVTHPYDAGDYVLIDGQYLLVHNLGVMGTSFISGDGQLVYAPTTVLMTKLITNVRRSGNMGETVTINIDFRTTSDQFWELHDRLSAWVASQSRDFGPGFDVRVADIIDVNQMIINIWLPHKGNWQELGKRFKRKTRFMLALKEILTDLEIKYELPAQRITQTVHRDAPTPPPVFDTSASPNQNQQSFATSDSSSVNNTLDAQAVADMKREKLRRERYNTDRSGAS